MRFGESVINLQRPVDRRPGSRECVSGSQDFLQRLRQSQRRVRVRKTGEREGISRIFFTGLLKVGQRLLGCRLSPFVPIEAALQKCFVRLAVHPADVGQAVLLLRCQLTP